MQTTRPEACTDAPVEIALPPLTGPQIEIIEADQREIDVEGAPRGAKSWGVLIKIWKLVWSHPGIQIFYCRWKDEDVDVHLKDLWRKIAALFPEWAQPAWNPTESAFDFPNASRVYLRSLKASEDSARYSKFKGLTLAVVVVEEASEVPRDYYARLKERLSQSQHPHTTEPYPYPLQIILVTNSVDDDHWIAEEFPVEDDVCIRPPRRYIRVDLLSNAVHLGDAVIAGYTSDYPEGHPERRTVIEGRRGVMKRGAPCYEGYFMRDRHVDRQLEINPYVPLLEGWDFSHARPAVLWAQYLAHLDRFVILGGVQGFDMILEIFVPHVLSVRKRWFPEARDVWSWCDPAGATNNSGSRVTAVTVLEDCGVSASFDQHANDAPERFAAIQAISGMMFRPLADGRPAFLMHPQCLEIRRRSGKVDERICELIVSSLQVGYVWDDDHAPPQSNPNVRRVRKNFSGDKFSHLMNCLEYVVIGNRLVRRGTDKGKARAAGRLDDVQIAQETAARHARGEFTLVEMLDRVARHGRQKDTVEIEHQRMMRSLRASQPVRRRIGGRAGF